MRWIRLEIIGKGDDRKRKVECVKISFYRFNEKVVKILILIRSLSFATFSPYANTDLLQEVICHHTVASSVTSEGVVFKSGRRPGALASADHLG